MNLHLYTIGHSNISIEEFIQMLKIHNIQIVCDVRSHPHSAYVPHFNAIKLRNTLIEHNIKYLYLGKELGPRKDNPEYYNNGKVQYNLIEQSQDFKNGIQRLVAGIQHYTIAIMCAEKDPINCHRAILICKNMPKDITIYHILGDSSLELHTDLEKRLVLQYFGNTATLFNTYDELLEQAYSLQAQKLAYAIEDTKE
jgi:uncharacterized protein (DUF488 family)